MRALPSVGIVQGFSTPFLMLLVMQITNNRRIMGRWTNAPGINILGGLTAVSMFTAAVGLIVTMLK